MKTCTKCHIEKDESEFNKDRKHGFQRWCRSCSIMAKREWRKLNESRVRNYEKEYRNDNRLKLIDRAREYRINYYDSNKERLIDEAKIYYQNNKEKRRRQIFDWSKENRDKMIKYAKKYRDNNKEKARIYAKTEKVRAKQKERSKKYTDELANHYVKSLLRRSGYSNDDIKKVPALLVVQKIKTFSKRIKNKNKYHEQI